MMVEQSKRFRRGMRQKKKAGGGFLSASGRSADAIAAEDRALRHRFPMLDLDLEPDLGPEQEVVEAGDVAKPATTPPLTLQDPIVAAPQATGDTPAKAADTAVSSQDKAEAVAPQTPVDPAALGASTWIDPQAGPRSKDSAAADKAFQEDAAVFEAAEEIDHWANLAPMPVQRSMLERNLIITASRKNPVHAAFDVLRARLLQALTDNGWKRVAITSPTRDCGKTFVAVNLAVALSRYENCRTVLLDMDMRNPSVAKTLGLRDVGHIGDYLRGTVDSRDQFYKFDTNDLKIGDNLAVAMNERIEPFASELMQEPATAKRLRQMEQELHPDVVLFDLPPALAHDDVIAFDGNFDGVLIVIDGTRSSASEVREVMRRIGESVPLLGVVLNKAEDATGDEYGY